jgi:hypothetical protein
MRASGDLSNVQWATRLGKRVRVRTTRGVGEGEVLNIGIKFVKVGLHAPIERKLIIGVTDLKARPE